MTDIEAIKARLEKATPGPWKIKNDSASGKDEFYGYWHTVGPFELLGKEAGADSLFIAHAPTDIAYLLERLASAERERDAARAETERIGRMLSLLVEDAAGGEAILTVGAIAQARPIHINASGEGRDDEVTITILY